MHQMSTSAFSTHTSLATPSAPPIQKFRLNNGLVMVIAENHYHPVVSLQMWIRRGIADEQVDEKGAAHVLEHLLCRSTKNRGIGVIENEVEKTGGEINAFASPDHSVFQFTGASRFFDPYLDLLSDAILHANLDDNELQNTLTRMKEEWRRSQNPERSLSTKLFASAFTRHPYGHSFIGDITHSPALSREQVRHYYQQNYTPENMVLVIVGDVDTKTVRHRIEQIFANVKGSASVNPRTQEPEQQAPRIQLISTHLADSDVAAAWPVPSLNHPDVPAIDLLSVILGQGESSRLASRLKHDNKLVTDTSSFAYLGKDPGLLTVGFTTSAAKTLTAYDALISEVYKLRRETVSEQELTKAKTLLLSDAFYQKETVQGIARKIGFFEVTTGDFAFEEHYYHAIEKVSPADLRRAANRYLTLSHLNVITLLPAAMKDNVKKEQLLANANKEESLLKTQNSVLSLSPDAFGIYRIVLPSKTVVLIQENHTVPVVEVRAAFLGGVRSEDSHNNGINQLLAHMLGHATKQHTHREIVNMLDGLAANIDGFVSRNSFGLRGEFLRSNFSTGFDLFAEMLTQPIFTSEELDQQRAMVLANIRRRKDNAEANTFDLFLETLYEHSPLALPLAGSLTPVSALRGEDLQNYFSQHYTRDKMVIAIHGDIFADDAIAQIQRLLGSTSNKTNEPIKQAASYSASSSGKTVVHMNEQLRTNFVLGFRGAQMTSPDRFALEILGRILDAPHDGYLVHALSDKHLASQVACYAIEGIEPGYFAVYVETKPEASDAAIDGVKTTIKQLTQEKVSDAELEAAKQYLIGMHATSTQKAGVHAASLALGELYGTGYDDDLKYDTRIGQVSKTDLLQVAKKYFDFDHLVLTMLKPASTSAPTQMPIR